MFDGQHNDVQSIRVANPHSEIPVLLTPESLAGRPSSVRRKSPTSPFTDPRKVEEHIHHTMERIRAHKAFRRHLGGAQNIESDSDLSVVGMQNLMSITAPVVCGRRRVAAHFPDLEYRATGCAVINVDPTWALKLCSGEK